MAEIFRSSGQWVYTPTHTGLGTGCMIPFYFEAAEVAGIDLSPAMLARAWRRQAKVAVPAELIEMDVMDLPFAGENFDAIVSTFLFCVLEPDHQLPGLK